MKSKPKKSRFKRREIKSKLAIKENVEIRKESIKALKTADIICYYSGYCEKSYNGKMGFGFIIKDKEGRVLDNLSEGQPKSASNTRVIAEHVCLSMLLRTLLSVNTEGKQILILGNDKLSVMQTKGAYKITSGMEYSFYAIPNRDMFNILSSHCDISWIPKDENQEAIKLSAEGASKIV